MEIAPAVGEQPDALAPGGGAEPELDLGEGGVERLDGGRDHGLHPERRRGDAEPAGAPSERGRDRLLAVLDLAQDAARVPEHQGAEPGRAKACGNALEQAAAELPLQAGDDAAQRRLGDGEPVGGGDDPLRVRDGKEPDQVAASFEHVSAPPCPGGLAADQTGEPHHAVSVSRAVPLPMPSVGLSPIATRARLLRTYGRSTYGRSVAVSKSVFLSRG